MGIWKQRIDVHSHTDAEWEEDRDAWVKALKAAPWGKGEQVAKMVEELKDATYEAYANAVLSDIYDRADIDRVWITVHHTPRREELGDG